MSEAPRILVVDDSHDLRELLTAGLRSAGYQVITASDGEEALLVATTLVPRLIILDIMMPIMNGWEFLRDVRKVAQLKDTKVMVLTAIGASIGEATSELAGADAHMDKPFAFTELLATVAELIGPAGPPVETGV
ncbi:MAG: response regulator [Deltaproteobacteria bacterium]|jgi:DNA-binding response OmpR family regulator|nr:response regulator [Deltaproteobacteria bacterium]